MIGIIAMFGLLMIGKVCLQILLYAATAVDSVCSSIVQLEAVNWCVGKVE
jgi:hypothetical protein